MFSPSPTNKRHFDDLQSQQQQVDCSTVSGKWTSDEEQYAWRLIDDFELGLLSKCAVTAFPYFVDSFKFLDDCEEGCTLRSYLARKLNCAPMRISKKFAGHNIGKHTFVRKSIGFLSPVSVSGMPYFFTSSSSSGSPSYYTKSPRDPRLMEYYSSSSDNARSPSHSCGSSSDDDEWDRPQKRFRYETAAPVSEAADWKDVLLFYCGNTFGANPVVKQERSSSSPLTDFDAINRCRVDSISEEFDDSFVGTYAGDDEDFALLLDL
jgi:hypothetical protein